MDGMTFENVVNQFLLGKPYSIKFANYFGSGFEYESKALLYVTCVYQLQKNNSAYDELELEKIRHFRDEMRNDDNLVFECIEFFKEKMK